MVEKDIINKWYPDWNGLDISHADWSRDGVSKEKRAFRAFKAKWPDRFVVVNDQGHYLVVIRSREDSKQPQEYHWSKILSNTIPFKSEQTAKSFVKANAGLPILNNSKNSSIMTLGDEKIQVKKVNDLVLDEKK